MPYVPTLIAGSEGGLNVGGILQQGIDLLGSIFGPSNGGLGMPPMYGGALPGGAMPWTGPGGGGVADLPYIDVVPQGSTCITPRQTTGRRLPSRVDVPTVDASGNVRYTTYKNMGRPILWSGDLAACKRVKRVATRARRAGGR